MFKLANNSNHEGNFVFQTCLLTGIIKMNTMLYPRIVFANFYRIFNCRLEKSIQLMNGLV